MGNLKERFLQEVLHYIKSKEAKEHVLKELSYHMKQAKVEMVSKGLSESEAEEKSVMQMGSPTELGQHFNKIYRPKMDWILLGLFLITIMMGLLPTLNVQDQYAENFLLKQTIYMVMGTAVALIVMFVDYRKMEKLTWFFLSSSLFILLALNFFPNVILNGVKYFRVAGLTFGGTTVLPLLLMFWACYLSKKKPKLLVILGIYLFTMLLYMGLPDMITQIIYSVLILALFFGSALKRKIIYSTIGTCFGLMAIFILIFLHHAPEYQMRRILGFLRPEDYADNAGYIYLKVKELITGGGWFGNQKHPIYMVEMTTDLAFANITYYFGWIIAGFLVIILSLLLVRMVMISGQIQDRFGKQLMVGVCALFSTQFVYNIGMVLGFLPIISMSLPFISYGMTPTLLNSFLIGLALSVYRRKHLVLVR
jgi:cell division protein FtsW (lipid II flippase)